ncbi:GH25 family lysozyme [Enterococcus faecalis]|uniref:GH25 family lysozyme n=1 Tax=Enterococcus faecalis TaxID=1351 RepID=UPI0025AFFF98|nr:GH25 family lysozyme [Enterococcus faecalis]
MTYKLTVSTYHFFSLKINKKQLIKPITMQMLQKFLSTLKITKRGFKNVVCYSSASWFNNNWMEYAVLDKENSWVAEWPANSSANCLLHTDTTAWQ